MPLINYFSSQIATLPAPLQAEAHSIVQQLHEKLPIQAPWISAHPDIADSLLRVCLCSRFIAENLLKTSDLLVDADFLAHLTSDARRLQFDSALVAATVTDEVSLMQALRRFRRREMLRIAWRDLSGWATLEETLLDLTALAETCIEFALNFLYLQATKLKGVPVLKDGTPFGMVVLGMGKLGAHELNFSSDIDLIFAYAESGELPDAQETSYQEFFSRLARSLVKVLDAVTVDGFVFRTDVRLRPFGDSGPMVMSFEGMENYYQTQAREWERYAMVKVRQVAGDFKTGKHLMAMFQPFVYRRYLDYGAIEELRSLKYMIIQELQRKDRLDNIKLGSGGIREIEFIGQAFQLVRGGQQKILQQRGILGVLQTLAEEHLMRPEEVAQLTNSYCFLRRVENRLQQYQDLQTHDLPDKPIEQEIVAYAMGYASWSLFSAEMDAVRKQVHQVFDQVFALSKQELRPQESAAVWLAREHDSAILTQLNALGFEDAAKVANVLSQFKRSAAIRRLTAKGAKVFDNLMPQLIKAMHIVPNPDVTLKRLLDLFEDVAGRNVYLSLLEENPDALTQLIKLSSASSWICEYLGCYPALFDELLDARSLYEPLSKASLEAELQQKIQASDRHDIEQVMILLRKFKQINVLKVAAADIMGVIPLMVVSDYLTYIAEVVVAEVVAYAWWLLTHKYGLPPGVTAVAEGFGVIGYGKLGGVELGYGSDLDLVFIYDCADGFAMTEGERPISCMQFYGRLGQQVRHILDTRMLSGILYEVDMRLRPNGDSGLLVANSQSYEQYLLENAWVWEHQALVRARFIAGDSAVKRVFEQTRVKVLSQPRDEQALKIAVRDMREKMRESLMSKEVGKFDLKQGKGGIADIEFIVQFNVLAHAAQNQELLINTGNIRLLEALSQLNFMPQDYALLLQEAYCAYRDRGHKAALQGAKAIVDTSEFVAFRRDCEQVWQILMV